MTAQKKRGDGWDDISESLKHFTGAGPECIRHGAVGSPGFQVVIVNTHLTGLWLLVERGAATREGHANIEEGGGGQRGGHKQRRLENKDKVLLQRRTPRLLIEINAPDSNVHHLGSNKGLRSQKGIDMVAAVGLVNGHMGAAGRVLQQEGRYLWGPVLSCHSDLIRGADQEEDQLSLSPIF